MITSTKNDSNKKANELFIRSIFAPTPKESEYLEAFQDGQVEAWKAAKELIIMSYNGGDFSSLDKFESFIEKWFNVDDVIAVVAKIQDIVYKKKDEQDLESMIADLNHNVLKMKDSADKSSVSDDSKLLRWLKELQWYRNKDAKQ